MNGTVNDLAVAGARPLAMRLSLILEEGLAADELRAEVEAIARAAEAAGVEIVAGDTKVVERGHADSMYICTTGVGGVDPRAALVAGRSSPGTAMLVSGAIGEHGTAIMLARGEFDLDAEIESDTRSLWPAVDALLEPPGPSLRCMRDATRGGVASVLNELARASRSRWSSARRRCPWTPPSRERRAARHRPDVRRERGQARGVRRAGGEPKRRSRRCAACPDASRPWRSER